MIRPLKEQIIIRAIPPSDSQNGIVIPDSAKEKTLQAEVIAVGTGRLKAGKDVVPRLVKALKALIDEPATLGAYADAEEAIAHAESTKTRIPFEVQVGDRILYHPSVARFDRQIEPEAVVGSTWAKQFERDEYFIIREDSVLAVLEQG